MRGSSSGGIEGAGGPRARPHPADRAPASRLSHEPEEGQRALRALTGGARAPSPPAPRRGTYRPPGSRIAPARVARAAVAHKHDLARDALPVREHPSRIPVLVALLAHRAPLARAQHACPAPPHARRQEP